MRNCLIYPWEVYQGELYSFHLISLTHHPSSVPSALLLCHPCFGSIAEIPPLVEMQYYSLSIKGFHPTRLNGDSLSSYHNPLAIFCPLQQAFFLLLCAIKLLSDVMYVSVQQLKFASQQAMFLRELQEQPC